MQQWRLGNLKRHPPHKQAVCKPHVAEYNPFGGLQTFQKGSEYRSNNITFTNRNILLDRIAFCTSSRRSCLSILSPKTLAASLLLSFNG
jgi:hypothetical protein